MNRLIETPAGVFMEHDCPEFERVVLPCSSGQVPGAGPRRFACEFCDVTLEEDDG